MGGLGARIEQPGEAFASVWLRFSDYCRGIPMDRTPPIEVIRALRREVGFACPVEACGSPYLSWHHFDPPWRVREHHDPDGMIALCMEHHRHADAGLFTTAQLREMKAAHAERDQIAERFPWMRERLLTVVGGNFYYETPVPVEFRGENVVSVSRDERGYLLLSAGMLTASEGPRMLIRDNVWYSVGTPTDLACPPSGKLVRAEYDNGDMLSIEFVPDMDLDALHRRYPGMAFQSESFDELPVAAVEITMRVGGTPIAFQPRKTELGGAVMSNCFISHCAVGLGFE